MTRDPLLALGGGRKKGTGERGGGKREKRWKRFVWKLLLTRHWFSALISHSVLKFPIREMKKRSEREMGLIHIGGEVKPGMPLSVSMDRKKKNTFSLLRKQKQWSSGVFLFCFIFFTCAVLRLDYSFLLSKHWRSIATKLLEGHIDTHRTSHWHLLQLQSFLWLVMISLGYR